MRKKSYFLFFILAIILSSCKNPLPEKMPDLGTDIGELELNTFIRLSAPKECNTFQSDEPLCLEVKNLSEQTWTFDKRKDIRIFQYHNKGWEEISDKMVHLGNTYTTLEPKGNFPEDNDIVSVFPEVEDRKPLMLRIFIIVNRQPLEGEKLDKGAFIDLSLNP